MIKGSTVLIIVLAVVALVSLSGCSSDGGHETMGHADAAGGLSWTAPSGWTAGPPQQMRAKTYIIKPVADDVDNAECAVFYFGNGQGGDKESNLARWANQFEQADGRESAELAVIKESETNGLKVTTIELDGIYKQAAGPMMEVKDMKLGWRLMGAIVEGPGGLVFFKMVGPEKTVKSSEGDFRALINSIKSARA